jgi:colanic acid/amylovoran biosynthesis protein
MIVELLGLHHANKGALLMLEAIDARIRQEFVGVRLAVPASTPFEVRARYGLWASVPRDHGRFDVAFLANWIPARFRRALGLAAPSDIDVILDASGFGYGDYWGTRKLERRLLGPLRRWKTHRKTVVLLSQALGPFETPGMKEAFAQVLRHADLVFVRDKESMKYVEAVTKGSPNVRLAPDFTNALHPPLPERLASVIGRSLVIPNQRVVGVPAQRQTYIEFLALALESIARTGREAILLVHEGADDHKLAAEVNAKLAVPVRVIDEPSPLTTKAIIAAADLVVSSRFHGLVSALSSAVPSLACGWSHKYGELMDDYGCREHMVDITQRASWVVQIERFLADAADAEFRACLAEAATRERARSEAMWHEVVMLLKSRQGKYNACTAISLVP